MQTHTLRKPSSGKEPYGKVFCIAFFSLLLVLLPILIADKGYFIYYGDYNSQQIPFYSLANDAVRSGSFGWNWFTDLGSNFIGSYSFYLLGSPFFWITTLLPRGAVTFSMPILLAAKHGIAAVTAYAYIRRFVHSQTAACVGGLLYAFSGFQIYNLFFNHFQDVTAFFPLLLIAMEELVNNNRKGVFALTVALMGILNYFFFTGQVVFLILYFIVRCFSKDFLATPKKFLYLAIESVLGVLLACFILLPSALAILANSRVSEHLYGNSLIAYNDSVRIWRIIQSFFMIPDAPARPNLFSSNTAKWSSIGGYLPLFGMAGALSFMKAKKRHWATILTVICAICACIPILNSAFYTFNGAYYARWFYMPILLLALMTAYALDHTNISLRFGITVSLAFLSACFLISFLPKKENDTVTWFSFANFPEHFYLVLILCALSLVFVILLHRARKKQKNVCKPALAGTICACILCTASIVYFGAQTPAGAKRYIDQAIDPEQEVSLSVDSNHFFRIDISENCDNYPMLWKLPCMRTFHSIVPASIMEFYHAIGVTRDVASRADLSYYTLRGLFSVQYYYDQIAEIDLSTESDPQSIALPGFSYRNTENGFRVYENTAYVPMGFTFDQYITESDWEACADNKRASLLMHAIVLNDRQVEQYGSNMQRMDSDHTTCTKEHYLEDCAARTASSCDSFTYDSNGFTATISAKSDNLVFFSVPYEAGWSATVDGKPVSIEQVDVGFMAVPVEAGDHTIVFTYETPGLHAGLLLSAGGLVLLLAYLLLCKKFCRKNLDAPHVHYYEDFDPDAVSAHTAYLEQLIQSPSSKDPS